MYNSLNSSIFYVSPSKGDDIYCNGYAPERDGAGNGPFKSLLKAFEAVSELRTAGVCRPVTVRLCEDIFVDKPIIISNTQSEITSAVNYAGEGITLESFGERKRIIGGMKLENWKNDTFNGKKCISAELPEKKNGEKWDVSELFFGGKRADKTRFPKGDATLKAVDTELGMAAADWNNTFYPQKWFIANKEDLKNINGIENATLSFYHYWIDEHTPVESYDAETGKIVLKYKARMAITAAYEENHPSAMNYYLENIPQMFSEKNQWYFDKDAGKIYYIPEKKINDLTKVDAYIPTAKKLIEVFGTKENKISDIRIRNLELMYTDSEYMSCYKNDEHGRLIEGPEEGFAADVQAVFAAYGAVSFEYAERCSVENCEIHGVGIHATEIKYGCNNIRIENNRMYDNGGGGVRIFGERAEGEEINMVHDCIIRGNTIEHCGVRYAASCGVLVCHAHNNEISENEICYLDYSGVSVGWIWGYKDSSTYGNVIRKNHIHHIGMGRLSDMGGIYLLGKQKGTVVSENTIHDVTSAVYGGWGIYLDEGSSYITVENNTVYDTKCECFIIHYGMQNTVKNNVFALGKNGICMMGRKESHDSVLIEENIMLTDGQPIYGKDCAIMSIQNRNNMIYDISGQEPVMYITEDGRKIGLDEWKCKFGKDCGSIVENPDFKDIEKRDFAFAKKK